MQKPIKKAKKGEMVEEKKEKIIEDFILQKTPKPFDVAECKLMDKTIRGEYGDLFPFGNKPIMEVKILSSDFFSCENKLFIIFCQRDTRIR
jgi:hypothetical protein